MVRPLVEAASKIQTSFLQLLSQACSNHLVPQEPHHSNHSSPNSWTITLNLNSTAKLPLSTAHFPRSNSNQFRRSTQFLSSSTRTDSCLLHYWATSTHLLLPFRAPQHRQLTLLQRIHQQRALPPHQFNPTSLWHQSEHCTVWINLNKCQASRINADTFKIYNTRNEPTLLLYNLP